MLEVKNLTKKYGANTAVSNLSFTVEKGKIYGFLGPNGAGKSTTMNIITGCLAPTEGQVLIDGIDVIESPVEAKRRIGFLPEIPPLYSEMTPFEYLSFVAEAKRVPKKERNEAIDSVMKKTGISEMSNRLIRNLSKGYRQRVGIAQAMLGDPDIIILDEPTVGLDPKQIIEIRELIKSLGESHTVILSSHILSEIQAVCDYCIIIAHGVMVASDSIENLGKKREGAIRVDLTVKSDASAVKKLLSEIPDILSFEVTEEGETSKAVISSEKDFELREKLFFAFAEKRLPILAMAGERDSLEDIYLQLTDDVNQSPETDLSESYENQFDEKGDDEE